MTTMPIRPLSQHLVNQIAAGEVIERPASVVKELLENSIDAGATRIEVTIEGGGTDRIEVVDDGRGVAADELPLAVAAHATSKIEQVADLESIATLGFRGEALASIAAVSRFRLLSRPGSARGRSGGAAADPSDEAGPAATTEAAVIEVDGGSLGSVEPAAGPVGTSVTVRNLFFNVPARRKFLKTEPTETGRVRDVVQAIALAHPAVGMRLRSGSRTVLDLPPRQSPRDRVLAILGTELAESLIEIDDEAGGVRLWGLIGTPELARTTARHQHLFVNGRRVVDRTISHALREGYRGLIEPGRHPTGALFVLVDPRAVDVNVHPAKAEVRFRDQSAVHGAVRRAVRAALERSEIRPSIELPSDGRPPAERRPGREAGFGRGDRDRPFGSGRTGGSHTNAGDSGGSGTGDRRADVRRTPASFPLEAVRSALDAPWAPATIGDESPSGPDDATEDTGDPGAPDHLHGAPRGPAGRGVPGEHPDTDGAIESFAGGATEAAHAGRPEQPGALPTITRAVEVLQVHDSYLVVQDESGLVIFDQHALHERVMFERLKDRVEANDLESQRLLIPATLTVGPAELEALERIRPLLGRLGIEAEAIGPRAIAVHAAPSLLLERGVEPAAFLEDLLGRVAEDDIGEGLEFSGDLDPTATHDDRTSAEQAPDGPDAASSADTHDDRASVGVDRALADVGPGADADGGRHPGDGGGYRADRGLETDDRPADGERHGREAVHRPGGTREFEAGSGIEAALHEVLDMMACKAAIKAGDRLTQHEIAELLAYRGRIERDTNCPHGRPTAVRLSIRDLERFFKRS